jgi:RNA polymerase sigma-70 factor (ECF subfamily)
MTHSDSPVVRASEQWVDRHGDALFRFAMIQVGKREVAEELVQETFLAALRSYGQYAGASSERTWLLGILKHKIGDYFRTQKRNRLRIQELEPQDDAWFTSSGQWRNCPSCCADNPAAAVERREFFEQLHKCVQELPPRQAAAFALRELEELAPPEICELLEVTPGALGQLLFRARLALRECLERYLYGSRGSGA